jgi:hypothetical protein
VRVVQEKPAQHIVEINAKALVAIGMRHAILLLGMQNILARERHARAPLDHAVEMDVVGVVELAAAAARENVLVQMNHLGTHPSVAARLATNEVHIFGWYYDIGAGEVSQYDPTGNCFQPLGGEQAQEARPDLTDGPCGERLAERLRVLDLQEEINQ